jgi:ADP-ribosylglycohydrolase
MSQQLRNLLQTSLLADSLALGAHWIYGEGEVTKRFGRVTELLPNFEGGYHSGKTRGAQTHYGDQTLLLWESLQHTGHFDLRDFASRWQTFWKTSSSYRDHATRETLAQLEAGVPITEAGSDSTELGGAARLAPLFVAMHEAALDTQIVSARTQTAFTHRSELVQDVAEYLTRIVYATLRGTALHEAIETASRRDYNALAASVIYDQAFHYSDQPLEELVPMFGQSCSTAQGLPVVLSLALRFENEPETALIENVELGGDSAARGLVLGLLLGSAQTENFLPARWLTHWQAQSIVGNL